MAEKHHTHEEFIKWLVEGHLPLAIPIFKKHGIISYSLFITPASLNGALKEKFEKIRPTWDFADFDCSLEYTIPDVETIQKVMADPDWPAALKDHEEWLDASKALLSLGYHVPYLLETGEVVNLPK
ncbi:hypothetical protein F4820DRAFT_469324 [Hypoxylon rubiginosum]|uniref:Uncharacterized protein n=1 Tax=Hypoxylon rubiginosum TaxID=110542 RepID=A0ACB9Z287_9PEZI|nr:hypothetical protein F4820DRAFT_469324 [Hypoxylon rubiginosum]